MTSAVTHPLVSAYLRDLEMLLHGVEPGERAEVLGGVREHLDASLVPGATDDDVRAVLAELGSPYSVADEAYAGRTSPTPIAPPRASAPRTWQAHTAVAINAACLAFLLLPLTFGMQGPSGLLSASWLFFLPWIAVCALSAATSVWTSKQQLASVLVIPATLLTLSAAIGVMLALVGPSPINFVPVIAVLGGAVWLLVRLSRSAARAANT
ncbi:hypothetical protein V6K52_15305 [Knoellia sp. S7-12]|uniref:DUF1700 domain-containing protein n=1 Tax=Knoellia sp. S7-12 TaxID=3126698 RepID=UPI0033675A82